MPEQLRSEVGPSLRICPSMATASHPPPIPHHHRTESAVRAEDSTRGILDCDPHPLQGII